MITIMAIGLAAVGAFCFAGAAFLQHDVVRRTPLNHALARPRWLAGLALIGLGAALHAVALALAPLVVVQPVGVLALPLVAWLHARAAGHRLNSVSRAAIVATAAGVALFVAFAAVASAAPPPPMRAYDQAIWWVTGAVTGLAALGSVTRGRTRCLAFAAAAGCGYALVSVLIRGIGQHVRDGDGTSLPLSLPLGVVAALVVGGILVQLGYVSGPPAVVVACLTLVDPLVSITVGVTLLGETASSAAAGTVLVGVVCALLAAVGTVALARHHPEAAARAVSTSPSQSSKELSCI